MDTPHSVYDDFFWAVYTKNVKLFSRILDAYPNLDVNYTDRSGNSALIIATNFNCPEIVEKLLATKNVNVNHENTYGQTALTTAIKPNSNIDIIRALLEAGADVNYPTHHQSALAKALSFKNKTEVISALLGAGANLDKINAAGESAFMIAARNSTFEVIRLLLLKPGFNPNFVLREGTRTATTALMQLAISGSPQVISALLAHPHFDPKILDQREVALRFAISNKNHHNIYTLLDSMTSQEIGAFSKSNCTFPDIFSSDAYFWKQLTIYNSELAQGNRPLAESLKVRMPVSILTSSLPEAIPTLPSDNQNLTPEVREPTPNSNFESFSLEDFTAKAVDKEETNQSSPASPVTFRFSELSITKNPEEKLKTEEKPEETKKPAPNSKKKGPTKWKPFV